MKGLDATELAMLRDSAKPIPEQPSSWSYAGHEIDAIYRLMWRGLVVRVLTATRTSLRWAGPHSR
jgi:hypothetical protein